MLSIRHSVLGAPMPLRITVDLIPQGDESRRRKIGELYIVNDGSGTREIGNYKFKLIGLTTGGGIERCHTGAYKKFKRARGYWSLIREILESINKHDTVTTR
jgi:hypothetical protein